MMAKRKKRPINKYRAVENALRRLGLQASTKDVVAELAAYGIDVSEGLVQVAKVKMLKDDGGAKRRMANLRQAAGRPVNPFLRKVPSPRSRRR